MMMINLLFSCSFSLWFSNISIICSQKLTLIQVPIYHSLQVPARDLRSRTKVQCLPIDIKIDVLRFVNLTVGFVQVAAKSL